MATYKVTGPDGKSYQVSAPDDASQEQVMQYVHENYGQAGVSQPGVAASPSQPAADLPALNNQFYAAQASGDEQGKLDAFRQIRAAGGTLQNPTQEQLSASVSNSPYNPTADMNGGQLQLAGFGESLTDAGRGIKQLGLAAGKALGVTGADEALKQSQADHSEAVQTDKYLNDTGYGKLGYAAGLAAQAAVPVGAGARAASLAGRVAAGAGTGALLSQLNPVGEGDYGSQKLEQAAIGAATGGALPVAGKVISGIVQRAFPIVEPAVKNLANRAAQLGIDVTPAQLSDSKFTKALKSVVNKFPLSGADVAMTAQQKQFNKAVGKTIGVDVNEITPDVMDKARDAIGKEFDRVAGNTQINIDPSFAQRISGIFQDMGNVLPDGETKPLANLINKVVDVSQNGTIPGKAYQALTAKGAPLNALQNAQNPTVRMYANQIRSALDDALERSSSQADVEALRAARGRYKNLKTIEDLVEKSTTGDISPALLLNQVRNANSQMAYGGGGDLADLARIGQRFLKDSVPDSGTSLRSGIQSGFDRFGNALAGGSIAGGAGAAAGAGAPILTGVLPATAAVIGAGRGVRSLLDNPKLAQAMLRRNGQAAEAWNNVLTSLGYGSGITGAGQQGDSP